MYRSEEVSWGGRLNQAAEKSASWADVSRYSMAYAPSSASGYFFTKGMHSQTTLGFRTHRP